jgi:predicted nucleic acid-binding Zn finger protein
VHTCTHGFKNDQKILERKPIPLNMFNPCAGTHTPSHDNRHDKRPARSIDEARLLANVNARALRLFQDNYRGRRLTATTVRVFSPQGEEYLVDQANGECDCPFFTKHLGKHPCKHILGADKLLSDQRVAQAHNIREWAGMALTESSARCRAEHVVGGGFRK